MAQTTGGGSFRAALGIVSPDGAAWTQAEPFTASVAISGGERATGEQQTMDGDTPIIKAGKRASLDVTVRYVYTEGAGEIFELVRAQYETAGGLLYFQWSPQDGSGFWFKTGAGICTQHEYPGGDVSSGDVTMSQFVIKCAAITKAAASG